MCANVAVNIFQPKSIKKLFGMKYFRMNIYGSLGEGFDG